MTFPFFLSLEAEGFGLMGGEVGAATRGDVVCCLAGVAAAPDVATEGDPIIFDEVERGDFGNGDWVHWEEYPVRLSPRGLLMA